MSAVPTSDFVAQQPAPSRAVRTHEHRAWLVAGLSLIVMAAEIWGGTTLNSIALISDGIHTSTHVAVMVMAGSAYIFARRRANDRRFAFGTGKAVDLAAFAGGVGLAVVSFFIGIESVERLIHPESVGFAEAAGVASLGLIVGLLSAVLLREGHHSHGGAAAAQGSVVHVRDLNLWAAYLHMVADVVTSVMTIGALALGAVMGWLWLDAAVGLLNAAVVAAFAVRLLRQASATLLDISPQPELADARHRLERAGASLVDVRLWRIGGSRFALVAKLSPASKGSVAHYRAAVSDMPNLGYLSLEVDAPERP